MVYNTKYCDFVALFLSVNLDVGARVCFFVYWICFMTCIDTAKSCREIVSCFTLLFGKDVKGKISSWKFWLIRARGRGGLEFNGQMPIKNLKVFCWWPLVATLGLFGKLSPSDDYKCYFIQIMATEQNCIFYLSHFYKLSQTIGMALLIIHVHVSWQDIHVPEQNSLLFLAHIYCFYYSRILLVYMKSRNHDGVHWILHFVFWGSVRCGVSYIYQVHPRSHDGMQSTKWKSSDTKPHTVRCSNTDSPALKPNARKMIKFFAKNLNFMT